MIGTYSKEEMLAELKLTCQTKEWVKLKQEIDEKVAEYKGKYKETPQVQIGPNIVYYPKDGSFRFLKQTETQ